MESMYYAAQLDLQVKEICLVRLDNQCTITMHCKCFTRSDQNYANSAMDRNNMSPTPLHVPQTKKGAVIQFHHFATLQLHCWWSPGLYIFCWLKKERWYNITILLHYNSLVDDRSPGVHFLWTKKERWYICHHFATLQHRCWWSTRMLHNKILCTLEKAPNWVLKHRWIDYMLML